MPPGTPNIKYIQTAVITGGLLNGFLDILFVTDVTIPINASERIIAPAKSSSWGIKLLLHGACYVSIKL